MKKYINIGHFSLFKNEKKINKAFMKFKDEKDGKFIYKKTYQTDESLFFDEIGKYGQGIVSLCNDKSIKLYDNAEAIADISIKYNNFFVNNSNKDGKYIFEYKVDDNIGRLYGYYKIKNGVKRKEFMYIHLQKRKVEVDYRNKDSFLIIPNKIINNNINKIDKKQFNRLCKRITILRKKYMLIKLSNMLKKIKRIYRK